MTSLPGPGEQDWGAGGRRVQESIIEVNADNTELETYCSFHHRECITGFFDNTSNQQAGNNRANADVLWQLTASIVRQMEEAAMPNQLWKNKIVRKREHDNEEKDSTKKIHKSINRILENAAAVSTMEVYLELAEGCKRFLNTNTKGTAEQELSHQFDKLNLTNVCFAPGIVQCLYHGKFISANLSTPSNFTAFAFYKQPLFQV